MKKTSEGKKRTFCVELKIHEGSASLVASTSAGGVSEIVGLFLLLLCCWREERLRRRRGMFFFFLNNIFGTDIYIYLLIKLDKIREKNVFWEFVWDSSLLTPCVLHIYSLIGYS